MFFNCYGCYRTFCESVCTNIEYNEKPFSFYLFLPYAAFYFFVDVYKRQAYNSMMEMAKAGFDKGLKLLGITEHAPMMPGTCHSLYFHNLKVVPRTMCGIEVMLGVELNILDYDGHVDLDERTLRQLDLKIASLHSVCIQPGTKMCIRDSRLSYQFCTAYSKSR